MDWESHGATSEFHDRKKHTQVWADR